MIGNINIQLCEFILSFFFPLPASQNSLFFYSLTSELRLGLKQWFYLQTHRKDEEPDRLSHKKKKKEQKRNKRKKKASLNYFLARKITVLAHLSVSVKAVEINQRGGASTLLAAAFNDARDTVKLQWRSNLCKNRNLFLMLSHPIAGCASPFSSILQTDDTKRSKDFRFFQKI